MQTLWPQEEADRGVQPNQEQEQLEEINESAISTTPWWRTKPGKASDASPHRFSDRDQTERMVRELQSLPAGKAKQFYRDTLRRQGYSITEVNTNSSEKLDLEVVKNKKVLALTINFNPETGKSTAIDASRVQNARGEQISKGEVQARFETEGE